eukprot:6177048-Pleurochrysis_carterae.AAC.2
MHTRGRASGKAAARGRAACACCARAHTHARRRLLCLQSSEQQCPDALSCVGQRAELQRSGSSRCAVAPDADGRKVDAVAQHLVLVVDHVVKRGHT